MPIIREELVDVCIVIAFLHQDLASASEGTMRVSAKFRVTAGRMLKLNIERRISLLT